MLALGVVGCGGTPTAPSRPAPVPTTTVRLTRTRYLAYGDSLTAGTTSAPTARLAVMDAGLPQSFPARLHRLMAGRYTAQKIAIINEGKPGEAVADGVRRFPATFQADAPEVVILLHGVNDITFATLAGVGRVAEAVNQIARDARLGGAEVVICTYPPQRPGAPRAAAPAVIAAFNTLLRDIARGEGALLVDFDRHLDPRLTGADGLHPTDEGYEQMARLLFDALRSRYEILPGSFD